MATLLLDSRLYPQYFPEFDSTKRTTTAYFALGTKAIDRSGNEYTYVRAGGAIAATDAVKLSGTEGLEAVVATGTTVTGEPFLGVGHAAFADNEYGFIQTRGTASVKTGNITAGAVVVPKTTAGTLNDAAAADVSSNPRAVAVTDDSGGVATITF